MKIRLFAVLAATVAFAVAAGAQTSTSTSTDTTKPTDSQTTAPTVKNVVVHDATLKGNGTTTTPLGIALPLNLAGSVNVVGDNSVSGLLTVGGGIKASSPSGNAIDVTGGVGGGSAGNVNGAGIKATGGAGTAGTIFGGVGVEAHGGTGSGTGVEAHGADSIGNFFGGKGLLAIGGVNSGTGVEAFGGNNTLGNQGGIGLRAQGGNSTGFKGGNGAVIGGGSATGGDGGVGLDLQGGSADGSDGATHVSGAGLVVRSGTAFNGASSGPAASFAGDVNIFGNLTKSSGSFKIDHPLDPENKYLSHSFVESPDMMNIYNGTTVTDAKGGATVLLPDWFEALNQDFRYQLTVIGTFAQAIIADEIKENRFTVKTSVPNVKVSWQVTGIRHDAYANLHRIAVEERKPEGERGLFIHPDAFGQPESRSIQVMRVAPKTENPIALGDQSQGTSQK